MLNSTIDEHSQSNEIDNDNKNNIVKVNYLNQLPSAPNWYSTQISDSNCLGHKDRIQSIAFHKYHSNLVISGSDDKTVRLWNIDDLSCVSYHKIHKNTITFVTSSPKLINNVDNSENTNVNSNGDLIVSSDKDGNLVFWRTETNHLEIIQPLSSNNTMITYLTISPLNPDILAIGYNNGLVVLFNILLKRIITKISAHDQDILSIQWLNTKTLLQSTSTDQQQQQPEHQQQQQTNDNIDNLYIATSSKDKSIKVWKQVGNKVEDSGMHQFIHWFPNKHSTQYQGITEKSQRPWITLNYSFELPHLLISTSTTCDILSWNLLDPKLKPEKFSTAHQRSIFNLTTTSILSSSSSSSTTKYSKSLISISLDRQIILWEGFKAKWKVTGLGGFVYSLDCDSFNPNQIAVACGDQTIRLWTPGNSNINYDSLDSKSLWKGIQSKVTALEINKISDHDLIAFGMDDGRVAIYNTSSNQTLVFPGGHKSEIYEVQWRNNCSNETSTTTEKLLYSVGGNSLLEWKSNANGSFSSEKVKCTNIFQLLSPVPLNTNLKITGFQWNQSGDKLALGMNDGTLEIYNSQFQLLSKIKNHKKYITRVKWNPFDKNYLVTASAEKTIYLYKLSENDQQSNTLNIQAIAQLVGHSTAVCGIAWSPHNNNLLASASADSTVQVWDISNVLQIDDNNNGDLPTIESISVLRGHESKVYSVLWSLTDPDILYSGGEDQSVKIWNFKLQKTTSNSVKKNNNNSKLISLPVTTTSTATVPTITPVNIESTSNSTTNTINNSKEIKIVEDLYSLSSTKKSNQILPISKSTEKSCSLESVVQLNDYYKSTQNTKQNESCEKVEIGGDDIFSLNLDDISRLIKQESDELLRKSDIDNYFSIEQWSGQEGFKESLYQIVKQGKLTANVVALSIQGGRDVWERMCLIYSKHLSCIGDYHMAVSYLLAIGKVDDAIQLYRQNRLWREAILLAKSRLPINHPILDQLFLDWADHSKDQNFYHALKCYLSTSKNNTQSKEKLLEIINSNPDKFSFLLNE
ncbi:component of gems 5 [Tieghemostelium lacteum]|uniref:Component of gems 5 n=1 Tax=Tieghemostelium lacteum TaxID=361077 RepID=A0A151Z8X8_TIELA|nr:component of gems 5 [Tieghemostelium lacteum]|eukprot:KYQ90408.1 component of gems 5 [Tieghemostelium lacteum]